MKTRPFITLILSGILILALSACGPEYTVQNPTTPPAGSPAVETSSAISSEIPASQETAPPVSTKSDREKAMEAYMSHINYIIQSSAGTEDGKLRCAVNPSKRAYDGDAQRILYDRYGFADLNSDGIEELIMLYTDRSENELNVIDVITYSTGREELKQVSKCYTTLELYPREMVFFDNGTIAVSHSGNEEPTYFFAGSDNSSQYDFSGRGELSGGLLQFQKSMDSQGNMILTEYILSAFEVSASREVSIEEANHLLSQIESGNNLKPVLKSFAGDKDIVAGQYYM